MALETIRAQRLDVKSERLLDPASSEWAACERHPVALIPTPISAVHQVSPYLAVSQGHGKVDRLEARVAHSERAISVRLSWANAVRDDRIADLDRFVDGGAVVFPLAEGANPITMGDAEKPVNAWLWRADQGEPFDVIGRGYSTTERRPAAESGLAAQALYQDGAWGLVFQRPLEVAKSGYARFAPGEPSGIAFAIWDGGNRERSAQKAVSGAFLKLELR